MSEYGNTRQEFEASIFDAATHFTVTRKVGQGRFETQTYKTLPEAMNATGVSVDGEWYDDPTAFACPTVWARSELPRWPCSPLPRFRDSVPAG